MITNVTASVGVAVSDPTTAQPLSLPDLVHQADVALLQARNHGGDQVIVAGGGTPGI